MSKRKRAFRGRTIDGELTAPACSESAVDYFRNILVGTRHLHRTKAKLFENVNETDDIATGAINMIVPELDVETCPSDKLWASVWRTADSLRLRPEAVRSPSNPIKANLKIVKTMLGFSDIEMDLLQFLVVHRLVKTLEEMTSMIGSVSLLGAAEILAMAIVRPRDEVLSAMAQRGRLVSSGLVNVDDDPETFSQKISAKRSLVDLVLLPGLDTRRFLDEFLPLAAPSTLVEDDYRHLASEISIAGQILAEALRTRKAGINILFYGATGAGKTELARLLAVTCGASLHVAGKEGEDGESLDAQDRLGSLLLGNKMLVSGKSLLLFDEMEDLFEAGRSGRYDKPSPSKQWFNLLLESNPVPTIWIANEVFGMDSAFRRRFAYAIEFRPLGIAQRRRAWQRHLGDKTVLGGEDIEHLADMFTVSAGQIATAMTAARLVARGEPDKATIERVVAPLEKLVRGVDAKPRHASGGDYLFEAANASVDLRAVADRLAMWRPGAGLGVSLCLYGPPGTGKSEFVHHLARQMDRRVLLKRVSDIQSPFVGVCEKNIAEAFREAEREGSVLLFDEADTFLRDRRAAKNSWEISQANEFLQQLEAYRGVIACTTNLWRNLDQAALRRFVFKIEFGFLDGEQAMMLFRSLLVSLLGSAPSENEMREVERGLARFVNLTPGDFAAVARRIKALGGEGLAALDLLAEVRSEAEAKEGAARAVGFARA